MKRPIAFMMACTLSLGLILPNGGIEASAKAKKPKLSKSKLSITAGKKKTIKMPLKQKKSNGRQVRKKLPA